MPEKRDYKATIYAPEGRLTPNEREDLKEFLRYDDTLDEKLDIPELEKTSDETRIITDLGEAAVKILAKYDLSEIRVPQKIIHIVDPEDWKKKFKGPAHFTAVIAGGHIYAQRTSDKMRFINELSHEMTHEISYIAKTTILLPEGDEGIAYLKTIKSRRGLVALLSAGEQFRGLNEALTEDMSALIRKEYGKLLGKSDREIEELGLMHCYVPQISLLEHLYKLVGDGDFARGRAMFHRGLITGDMSMLKEAEKRKKGAMKILIKMGDKPEDAFWAARQLGFDEVIKNYEKFQKENYEV